MEKRIQDFSLNATKEKKFTKDNWIKEVSRNSVYFFYYCHFPKESNLTFKVPLGKAYLVISCSVISELILACTLIKVP